MKQVKILKNNLITNFGQFETEEELNSWLSFHIANKTFGLPERPELVLNEETGELVETGVILPAEYEVVIEDISAQVEQEKINQEALEFLAKTDWMVIRAMEKGLELSPEFKAERQAARDKIV